MFGRPPFLLLHLDFGPFPVSVFWTETFLVARVVDEWLGDRRWWYLGVVRGLANIGVQGVEVFLETQHRLSDQIDQWLVQGAELETAATRHLHCPRPNLIVIRDEVQAGSTAAKDGTDSKAEFLRTEYLDVGTEDDPIESWDLPTQEYEEDGGLGHLHQA